MCVIVFECPAHIGWKFVPSELEISTVHIVSLLIFWLHYCSWLIEPLNMLFYWLTNIIWQISKMLEIWRIHVCKGIVGVHFLTLWNAISDECSPEHFPNVYIQAFMLQNNQMRLSFRAITITINFKTSKTCISYKKKILLYNRNYKWKMRFM